MGISLNESDYKTININTEFIINFTLIFVFYFNFSNSYLFFYFHRLVFFPSFGVCSINLQGWYSILPDDSPWNQTINRSIYFYLMPIFHRFFESIFFANVLTFFSFVPEQLQYGCLKKVCNGKFSNYKVYFDCWSNDESTCRYGQMTYLIILRTIYWILSYVFYLSSNFGFFLIFVLFFSELLC